MLAESHSGIMIYLLYWIPLIAQRQRQGWRQWRAHGLLYKIFPRSFLVRRRVLRYYKHSHTRKMQISAICRPATSRSVPLSHRLPVTAVTFPRLVNSELVLPTDLPPSPIRLDKPLQSRARHFRRKIRSHVDTATYRRIKTALLVLWFPRWWMRARLSLSHATSYLVFTPFPPCSSAP